MNEENNLNNVSTEVPTPAEPAPEETPVPDQNPTPVETPVQPVEVNVTNSVPPEPPEPGKKKSSALLVCLLVVILLGAVCYGLYAYTDIFKSKTNKDSNTTTTTTTTTATDKITFTSIDEYVAATKEDEDFNTLIIDGEKVLTELDFDLNNKCISDGDKVAFEIGTNKIEYNCKAEYTQDDVCEKFWSATIKVNDKFTKDFKSCEECAIFSTYVGKNAYIDMLQGGCSLSAYNELKVYDLDGKLVEETTYGSFYSTKEDYSDQENIKPIVKDNKIYFIHAEPTNGKNTTCTLKYIDLDASNPTIVDSGISTSCTIDE